MAKIQKIDSVAKFSEVCTLYWSP